MSKEADLTVEVGGASTFKPVDSINRKFNIIKVAGSATNLEYIKHEDLVFEERKKMS